MSTLSGNIAGTVRPFLTQRRVFPGGGLVSLGDLKKRKRKAGPKVGVGDLVHSVARVEEKRSTEKVGDDKWVIKPSGKTGKWRDAANKHVFWPDDGSAPIGLPKSAQKGKGGGGTNPNAPDFDSKDMKALERKLKLTMMKLKKKGGKAPKGAEKAVKGMLDAIKSKDPKKFKAANAKLGKAVR